MYNSEAQFAGAQLARCQFGSGAPFAKAWFVEAQFAGETENRANESEEPNLSGLRRGARFSGVQFVGAQFA